MTHEGFAIDQQWWHVWRRKNAHWLDEVSCGAGLPDSHVRVRQSSRRIPGDDRSLKAEGLTIEAVTCGGKIDLSAVRAIRNHINKHDIDVVHTHGYKADIYGFAAAHKRRTPIVATSHYWTRSTTALRFYAYCDQLVLRHFDGVVAVSRDIASEMVASRHSR